MTPRPRGRAVTALGAVLAVVLAGYLVARGIVELVTVHYGNPASYRNDWGGPSLAGVLVVHSGPAVVLLGAAGALLYRRRRAASAGRGRDR